jgi:hypothetical protein
MLILAIVHALKKNTFESPCHLHITLAREGYNTSALHFNTPPPVCTFQMFCSLHRKKKRLFQFVFQLHHCTKKRATDNKMNPQVREKKGNKSRKENGIIFTYRLERPLDR